MKFIVLQENILKSVQDAVRFVSNKPQIPSLQGVHLTTKEGQLHLKTTDLKVGFHTQVGGKVEQEGECVVPAKVFSELLSSLSPGSVVLELLEGSLLVLQKHVHSKLQTFPTEDFPPFPTTAGKEFELPFQTLTDVIAHVTYAASLDETRPVLTALYLSVSDQKLTAVCTDGYRLVLQQEDLKEPVENFHVMISAKVASEIVKTLSRHSPTNCRFGVSDELAQVTFIVGTTTIFVRSIEGQFPPYERILPTAFALQTTIDRQEWIHALKQASIFSRESSSIVTLSLKDNICTVQASSTSVGEHQSEVVLSPNVSEEKTIAFNSKFLLDTLLHMETERVQFHMNDGLKPAVIRPEASENLTCVIMPFKR